MAESAHASARLTRFHDGWRYWLPDMPLGELLCVDDGSGHSMLTLAPACDRLTVVPRSSAVATRLRRMAVRAGLANVQVLDAGSAARWPETRWDGAVINAAGWTAESGTGGAGGLRDLLAQVRERVGVEGFVLVTAANRLADMRLRSGMAAMPVLGARGLNRRLHAAGFERTRVWPILMHGARILEVLGDRGFERLAETDAASRRRRALLGPLGSRWLAPAYMALASNRRLTTRAEALAASARPGDTIRRSLVQAEKLILAVGPPAGREPDRIVIAVSSSEQREGLRAQVATLRAAESWLEGLSDLVPRVRGVGMARDTEYMVIDRMRGICIDEPVADLDMLAARAVELLERLALATASVRTVDATLWEGALRELFRRAAERHPGTAALFGEIERTLRIALEGLEIPLVRVHGDYKIENLVIDPVTRELSGLIDWELSRAQGLPVVDLYYLLAYNRLLTRGEDFESFVRDTLLPGRWSPTERALLERYEEAVALSPTVAAAMPSLMVVDALAYRFFYDMECPEDRAHVLQLVESVVAHLGGGADALAATGTEARS